MTRITVVGGGKMGEALIAGIVANAGSPTASGNDVAVSVVEPDASRADELVKRYGIEQLPNAKAAAESELLILAVKPQIIAKVGRELADQLDSKHVVISVAAGATLGFLAKVFGGDVQLVRAMPNTPALVGKGATGLSFGGNVSSESRVLVREIFSAVGAVVEIDDELQDAVTSVSGSGPAYFFAFVEALTVGGVEQGLDAKTAELLAKQTLIGAAAMLEETGDSATTLRENVTSPNGTTQAALESLTANGLADTVVKAEHAAAARSAEMTEELLRQIDS